VVLEDEVVVVTNGFRGLKALVGRVLVPAAVVPAAAVSLVLDALEAPVTAPKRAELRNAVPRCGFAGSSLSFKFLAASVRLTAILSFPASFAASFVPSFAVSSFFSTAAFVSPEALLVSNTDVLLDSGAGTFGAVGVTGITASSPSRPELSAVILPLSAVCLPELAVVGRTKLLGDGATSVLGDGGIRDVAVDVGETICDADVGDGGMILEAGVEVTGVEGASVTGVLDGLRIGVGSALSRGRGRPVGVVGVAEEGVEVDGTGSGMVARGVRDCCFVDRAVVDYEAERYCFGFAFGVIRS
jgi:hypothetical protein